MMEAIILAGGLGTRLRSEVPDLPKCMAPVAGRPFLSHLIDSLRMQGVERFIFSLGYLSHMVTAYLETAYPTLDYVTVIESEPLGTGGAILLCTEKVQSSHVVIANGDTFFRVDIPRLMDFHLQNGSCCTLALKPMQRFDRYGVVECDSKARLLSFREKQWYEQGLINGGLYILDMACFRKKTFPAKFSFEKDFLEAEVASGSLYGLVQKGYFIDIGIPEDYQEAQRTLRQPALDLDAIDRSWTLFLDRDGVINEERVGHYVLRWDEFIFSAGVLDSFRMLSSRFEKIIVVSNQRGVGRELMTEADLQSIHLEMQREVAIAGGHIDRIYYCTEKDDRNFYRKPNPGMAFRASQDFPQIDLRKSIMVGNKPSDMRFGRAAGMFTVFITSTNPDQPFPHPDIDAIFPSLAAFAAALQS